MEEFKIYIVTSSEEGKQILKRGHDEGSILTQGDRKNYYNIDPTGYFVGKLYGETISNICILKQNAKYAYIGQCVVEKSYRGKGYGGKRFEHALNGVDSSYNIALDAVLKLVPCYEKHGFQRAWVSHRYMNGGGSIMSMEDEPTQDDDTIRPTAEIDFSKLTEYDTEVFGVVRQSFLKRWLTTPHTKRFVAVDGKGELQGYIVIKKVWDTNRYKIAQ